ncbi:class I SAM-dependent methyltransferase [Afifella pfennigii]|uniref:class I SAM-dependent methyltransferase n=1 Tax=Afifella pfennigii TaxID=209897 RepID=UPI00047EA823|nr:class I SAM-dependent methyltransferase [Afifella pfennigii]
MSTESSEMRYEFGKNWSRFAKKSFSQERVDIAAKHMMSLLKRDNLEGVRFLDIGCGSGIHSLAAFQAGAAEVRSFDYDPNSVETTQKMWEFAGRPDNWTIERGDVLDDAYVASLGTWDLVYSWGVLHHTGDVWKAVENARKRVAEGGTFYIALYAADVQPDPDFWLRIKQEYNQASETKRRRMEAWYVWTYMLNRRPWRLPHLGWRMVHHRMTRGMSLFTDIRDWLGGWPMEFVYDQDVIDRMKETGLQLENIKTGEACSEYVFRDGRTPVSPAA